MMERSQMPGAPGAEALRSEVNAATESLIGSQRGNKEAEEAIKLLSAEIMAAYGLCRSVETDQHLAENS